MRASDGVRTPSWPLPSEIHDRKVQWLIFALVAVTVAAIWLGSVKQPGWVDIDQSTYTRTVDLMQHGKNYYVAMDSALRSGNRGLPSTSIHAFRLPTIFWFWQLTHTFSWPAALAVLIASASLLGAMSWPLLGAAVLFWLVAMAHPLHNATWALVEFWVLPLALLAVLAIRKGAWGWAVVAALGAALVREQAVLLLFGGALAAWAYRSHIWPWVVATFAWGVFIFWHGLQVTPLLSSAGYEPPLAHGSIWMMFAMAGPWIGVAAPILVGFSMWRNRFRPEWWLVLPFVTVIPMLGLFMDRPYWGIPVLPLALACWHHRAPDIEDTVQTAPRMIPVLPTV
jgi:hypothetical protein